MTPTLPKLELSGNGHKSEPIPITTPKQVIELCKAQNLKIVDVKFIDLPGMWQHFSMSAGELSEDLFSDGIGFDGSSIRGFQSIHESDMLLVADATTAVIDPACAIPTLSLVCNVVDPLTRQPYSRDARYIAQKAEKYLKQTGIATTSFFGPEAEFFIFDNVRFDQNQHYGYYYIDSDEGIWNSGRENNGKPNLGNRMRNKEGYFPVAPADTLQDLRSEIILRLIEAGVAVEVHHHEVATAGQCEIDLRFQSLTKMADNLMMYKYVVKNVARAHNKTATFMPKPLYGDNGSGMHCHQSLWNNEMPLFFEAKGYAGLSQTALWYIGGLLKHAPALLGLVAPTTNSYRRLVPGYEAPVNLVYSQRNRSAAVRIPMYSTNPKTKRIEFRPPDATTNPYLAFAAMLMAGLDGIQNKIDPGQPMDMDLYESEEGKHVKQVPGSLELTLKALEDDHEFLLKGDVFTKDVIETWIEMKRKKDIDPVRLRPHPYEFFLYYDV
ncbi:MAG: type I glutamate--ammonia ligase [Chloroflexi bacterium]|nr:type I glutamate--ammonia ligase [Chloroflexota bacterium]